MTAAMMLPMTLSDEFAGQLQLAATINISVTTKHILQLIAGMHFRNIAS
jgi:hypothetical protein